MNNIYIGNRYVPVFANPVEWDNLRSFEPLTIVTYQGTSYTSKKTVPVGTALNNQEYWVVTGNFNQQLLQCLNDISAAQVDIDENTASINNLKAGGVNDESLTLSKLTSEALEMIKNDYVHVEYFGAKGDGTTDDTQSINNCFAYCITNGLTAVFLNKTYIYNGSGVAVPNMKGNNTKLKGNITNLYPTKNCLIENFIIEQTSNGEAGCFVCEVVKEKIQIINVKYIGLGRTAQPIFRGACETFLLKDLFMKNVGRAIIYTDGYANSVACSGIIENINCYNADTLIDFECSKKITSVNICNIQQYNDIGYASYTSGADTVLMSGCKNVTVSNITGVNVGERVIYINTTDYLTVDGVTAYNCEVMKYAGLENSISQHAVIKNLTGIGVGNHGFTLYDVDDVVVQNVYMKGNGLFNSDIFNLIHFCSNVRIKDVTIENTYGNGFLIHNDRGTVNAIHDIFIDGLVCRNIGLSVEYAGLRVLGAVRNGIQNLYVTNYKSEIDKGAYKSSNSCAIECIGCNGGYFDGVGYGYYKAIDGSFCDNIHLTMKGTFAYLFGYAGLVSFCSTLNLEFKFSGRKTTIMKTSTNPGSIHIVGSCNANDLIQTFDNIACINGYLTTATGSYKVTYVGGVLYTNNLVGVIPDCTWDNTTKALSSGTLPCVVDLVGMI